MPRRSRAAPLPLEAIRDLIGLCRALYAAWKAEGVRPGKLEHLRYASQTLELVPVSTLVNSVKNDVPECAAPV